jgi:Urocanase Rossmann-like domain
MNLPRQTSNRKEEGLTAGAQSAAALEFFVRVERAFEALLAAGAADAAIGLGGKLFYAGELDGDGRALIVAANIAGAASLAATADPAAQKQALRDGIADFVVNSLDESLRILKNQLRKREPAAVCVGLEPAAIECEMQERGVVPDILRADALLRGESQNAISSAKSVILTWTVDAAPAQWLPRLDAIALDCFDDDAWRRRRWLRLSPRYLGRLAQGLRMMRCAPALAEAFVEKARLAVKRGAIGTTVEIRLHYADDRVELRRLTPD